MRISDWSSDVCSSDLADRGRAGEADLADHRAREQMPADHVGVAIDELDDVAGDTSIDNAEHDSAGAARRFLGRLREHDAARGTRRGVLLDHHIDRAVPRAESSDRADGRIDLQGRVWGKGGPER